MSWKDIIKQPAIPLGALAQGGRDGKISAIMQQLPNDLQELQKGITDKQSGIRTAEQMKTRLDELIRLFNQPNTMPSPGQTNFMAPSQETMIPSPQPVPPPQTQQ